MRPRRLPSVSEKGSAAREPGQRAQATSTERSTPPGPPGADGVLPPARRAGYGVGGPEDSWVKSLSHVDFLRNPQGCIFV